MKKFLLLIVLGVILGVGTAHAASVSIAGAGGAGDWIDNVYEMDWSSAGSGLATDIGPFGTAISIGDVFTFYYQASLTGLLDELGADIDGLDTTYEYTIVAVFQEIVTDVYTTGSGATSAEFATTGVGSWYVYYDDDADSDVYTGYGFDDGTVVMSGTIAAGQLSYFTATSTSTGIGVHSLIGLVDDVNEDYISTGSSELAIFSFDFEGTQDYPAGNSETIGFFYDADGGDDEGNLTAYTVDTTSDIVLKADSSSNFYVSTVPEPSTMLLLGLGLISLGGIARKKRNS